VTGETAGTAATGIAAAERAAAAVEEQEVEIAAVVSVDDMPGKSAVVAGAAVETD
jgi:hypothetical protein